MNEFQKDNPKKDLMLMPLFATRVFAYNFRVIDIKIG